MNSLEQLILNNLKDYPEWSEYNSVVLDFIRSHTEKRPDMCIEGCKCLIEGISKFIYFSLASDIQNQGKWVHLPFKEKVEKCVSALGLNGYEDEFLRENLNLTYKLGQIRNERGDISHGQAYPKSSYSDIAFAKFIGLWAEGLCYFLLSRYITVKRTQSSTVEEGLYNSSQFSEFDQYLDRLHPDVKYIAYSKALKEQDKLQYELLMDGYYNT